MAATLNRTLFRGLKLLELLAGQPEGLALYELADRLELPRSTAYNLARTLTEMDYLRFDPVTNQYTLGLRMFEVGSAAIQRIDILSVIRSCMSEVYQQINETMHLGIRTEKDVLYIDKMESTRSFRMNSYVGCRQPLYSTALGKAILAGMTDSEVRSLYHHAVFKPSTPQTIASREELPKALSVIRERGYAIERDESAQGISCAAVALPDQSGKPMYAISVSVPSYLMEDSELARYGRLLLGAKEKIVRFYCTANVLQQS